jgi:hypothetical protein
MEVNYGIRLGVAVIWLTCAGAGAAQRPETAPAQGGTRPAISQNADQAEHDALRALVPLYEQAANQGKLDVLKPCLDAEFSGVMVTGEEVTSFASLEAYWAKIKGLLGEGGSYRVKVNVADTAILSGDLAVAHGTTEDVVNTRGRVYRFESRWTAVCRKRDGQWKLLRIQASMDPVANPFVLSAVRATSILFGLIAGIAGLVVGWILHLLLVRRRNARMP